MKAAAMERKTVGRILPTRTPADRRDFEDWPSGQGESAKAPEKRYKMRAPEIRLRAGA
ncbi:hypothetical protein [Burkholderia sp. Ax-1719]|uniref:hypothetical protein n=1 Tax=Burkholderia sp. Ax-1719 TaxID=2608334 RepID=UPI00141EC942|nr:hypothetical protein [Burkholderia sp. Ax-1719]